MDFPQEHFSNPGVAALARRLWISAAQQKLVTYEQAAAIYGTPVKGVCDALDEISRYTFREHGFLLSAIVISAQDGCPSEGFYRNAVELGRGVMGHLEFWVRELAKTLKSTEGTFKAFKAPEADR